MNTPNDSTIFSARCRDCGFAVEYEKAADDNRDDASIGSEIQTTISEHAASTGHRVTPATVAGKIKEIELTIRFS